MNSDQLPVCDYEGSDYQHSFWDQGDREYEDRVEAIALKRLIPNSGKLLLEIGAGAGRNTPRYPGFERIVLLDYSKTQLQQAQERLGRSTRYIYVVADAYRLPFIPGLFDAATMIRTLHHISEPLLVLKQIRQVLQPGSPFLLEYANKQNLKAVLRFMLRRQDWNPFSLETVEFARLNFDFHPQQITLWLKECQFETKRRLTVSHFRLGLFKRWFPLPLLVMMDSLAQWTGKWWQLAPSVFTLNIATGETPQAKAGLFFCCPQCGSMHLKESSQSLACPECQQNWLIEDGIYIFRK